MIRRHFFLVGALVVLVLVLLAGGLRLLLTPSGPQGGGAAMAQGARGPGGPGGMRGGPGRGSPVTLVAAANRQFSDRINVLGVAKGRQSVTITSSTAELARRVLFRDGQYVRQGQVLVELDSREQEADIAQAQVRVVQALRDNERWQELARRGVAPRAMAEQYAAAYQTARAALAAAQARRLDRSVRAPFSGVVGLSDIAPGALIAPGAPIVTLDDVSVIRVDFQVPDRYLATIRPGMAISARSDAFPDMVAPGSIAQLDTRIDERTRSITARAEFPNSDRRLLPGMMLRVGIEQSQRQAVALPEAAVQFEGDEAFVFVAVRGTPGGGQRARGGAPGRGAQGQGAQGQGGQRAGGQAGQGGSGLSAEKRRVTIGVNQDGFIEIRSGLRPGEQVVADGLNRIQDGQPLMVAEAPRGPPGRPGAAGGALGGGRPPAGGGRPG